MADVRSLLRSELASRNQSQPTKPSSKKRKAGADEPTDSRPKKSRSASSTQSLAHIRQQQQQEEAAKAKRSSLHVASPPDLDTVPEEDVTGQQVDVEGLVEDTEEVAASEESKHVPAPSHDVDEDEWAAFEREVAAVEAKKEVDGPSTAPRSVFNAAATIEAAPMSAQELAAQAREEQSTQRGRREIEAEEEKEEADQRTMEEFEEMEGLEERVKELRERREMLRRGSHGQGDGDGQATGPEAVRDDEDPAKEDALDEESDEDEDEDEWDMWGRR